MFEPNLSVSMTRATYLRLTQKVICFLCFTLIVHFSYSQDSVESTLIRVTGTVKDNDSSEPLKASVYYEKLPYYDDIGISSTTEATGIYELSMIKNVKYAITIKADGFKDLNDEFEVKDDGTKNFEKNFVMFPDAAHEKIELQNLIFARGKAVIDRSSYAELDEFAIWLDARPNTLVQLEGHTDFQGNAQANMILSQERVDAVKAYITKRGIKKSRIAVKAFGGTQPLTRDRTPEGRTSNRRVEVRILQQ